MINADNPLELAEAFAHRSPLEVEAISAAARMTHEINSALRDAVQADGCATRVRRLQHAQATLTVLLAFRERFTFLELRNLPTVEADIARLEREFSAKGWFGIARITPLDPDNDYAVARIYAEALATAGVAARQPYPRPPHSKGAEPPRRHK